MKILKVNPENLRESEEAIVEATKTMLTGGTVIFPTDTVYGLGCDATNEMAIKRIFKMKNRQETKPLAIIVRDVETVKKIAFVDMRLEKALNTILPGAVTVVLWKKYKLPEILTAREQTIGLRIPDYKLTQFLAENMGRPYVATSANISGQQATNKIGEVLNSFEKGFLKPDLVLDAGDLKCCEPSTVLDLSVAKPKITRIGPVSPKKLKEILSV